MDGVHPIAEVLSKAAGGDFPTVDGGWQRVEPWRPGVEGVVAFTGRAYLAVDDDVSDGTLVSLGPDGFGGASNPRLVSRPRRERLDRRPRHRARRTRHRRRAGPRAPQRPAQPPPCRARHVGAERRRRPSGMPLPDDHTFVTLSTGWVGCPRSASRSTRRKDHVGADLVRDALTLLPEGEVVVAGLRPGQRPGPARLPVGRLRAGRVGAALAPRALTVARPRLAAPSPVHGRP